MYHANAPLTFEGRRRLIERCLHRPQAHVAAEMGISRQCVSKWFGRWRRYGELGLYERSSQPHRQPTATSAETIAKIEDFRREHKWSARRIAAELREPVSVRTVSRVLERAGLNRRKFIDPGGEVNRQPQRIRACWPGHMVHLDVKKVGRIPDGGGWRAHGKGSPQALAGDRAKAAGTTRGGYAYLHSAIDGHTRIAYTEHCENERGLTAAGFWSRARAFFAIHGITRINRVITDNGACYRSGVFNERLNAGHHQYIAPYTPRHNGKVERYNRILAEELLYARVYDSEDSRAQAVRVWNIHYNYHRPHTAIGDQPPAAKARHHVTNVMASYT